MNDQDKLILWLQTDITTNKLVMNEIIYIYTDLLELLESLDQNFKYDFNIILIRLSSFLFQNSL
tara:strand:- start:1153 stop:1344 length:192 start_codon:yes stop_codon:yes gene_type:complete